MINMQPIEHAWALLKFSPLGRNMARRGLGNPMQQGRAGQMAQRRPQGTGPAPPPPQPPRPPPKPITGPPGTGIQTQLDDPRFAANAGYTSEFTLPTAEDIQE